MKVTKERAYALEIKRSDGGTYKGTEFSAYERFSFLCRGESEVRHFYLDGVPEGLKTSIRNIVSAGWATPFDLSGEIDGKGRLALETVEKVETDAEVLFSEEDFV